jgi:hypothetical protein
LNPLGPIVDGFRTVVLRLGELEMFALNRELLALRLTKLLQQAGEPVYVLFVHHCPSQKISVRGVDSKKAVLLFPGWRTEDESAA